MDWGPEQASNLAEVAAKWWDSKDGSQRVGFWATCHLGPLEWSDTQQEAE